MKADDLSDTLDDCSVEIFLDEKIKCMSEATGALLLNPLLKH